LPLYPSACKLSPMAECPRCNRRAGKRYCPALRTKICAVCCARERMIDLACPETCPYLRSARDSISDREHKLREREAAASGQVMPKVTERMIHVILRIEGGVLKAKRGIEGAALDDLVDAEILAAVENAMRNYRTEESGLIYEHAAATSRIAEVGRRIRAEIDRLGEELPDATRPPTGEIVQSLERARAMIESHIKRGEGDRSYLRFISLFHPYPEEAAGPRIII
jgi:hypothetical protein